MKYWMKYYKTTQNLLLPTVNVSVNRIQHSYNSKHMLQDHDVHEEYTSCNLLIHLSQEAHISWMLGSLLCEYSLSQHRWNSWIILLPWWCHQLGTFSALLALCEGIHRSHVDSPHKGQWRGVLMFSLICAWTNGCASNRSACEFGRDCAYYDVTVMVVAYGMQFLTHLLP